MKTATKKKRTVFTKRRYPAAFKAAALATLDANGGNVERTAKDLDVPRVTLRSWDRDRDAAAPLQDRQAARRTLREEFEVTIRRLLAKLDVRDTDPVEKGAAAIGLLTDRLLQLASIGSLGGDATPGPGTTVDITAAIANLNNDELRQLVDLHSKLRGEPPMLQASDLSNPVIVADEDTQ